VLARGGQRARVVQQGPAGPEGAPGPASGRPRLLAYQAAARAGLGMSTSLGKHQFFPWLRRGAGVDVDPAKTENPDGSADARAPIPVGITLHKTLAGADAGTVQASVSAQLYGPGDVIGVDPRHGIRTEPRHLTANYEPNYFAGIEFDHPELPWLFTPAAPSGDRLDRKSTRLNSS